MNYCYRPMQMMRSTLLPYCSKTTVHNFDCFLCVSLQRSARAASEESDCVFTELIRSIELKRFEVRELIKAQEKTAVSQAEQLLDKIQKEITELKKNEAELDKLSHTDDHINFLQVTLLRFICFFRLSGQNLSDLDTQIKIQSLLVSVFVNPELSVAPCSTGAVNFALSHCWPQPHLWPCDDSRVRF